MSEDTENLVRAKRQPTRADGLRTQKLIRDTTAALLAEVGFERLSTNLICKQAGLTTPALYRYYPNKYAVLFDIAHELLYWQREELTAWIDGGGLVWTDRAGGLESVGALQARMRSVADRQVGAVWIMRAMRSIPKLREVRIIARNVMLADLLAAAQSRYPGRSAEELAVPIRLFSEILHLGIEMALDETDLDTPRLFGTVALNLVVYMEALASAE